MMLVCQGVFRIAGGSSRVKKLKVCWFVFFSNNTFAVVSILGCVTCKLALHSLAAYLLSGLQRSSNAAVYKADVNKDGGC